MMETLEATLLLLRASTEINETIPLNLLPQLITDLAKAPQGVLIGIQGLHLVDTKQGLTEKELDSLVMLLLQLHQGFKVLQVDQILGVEEELQQVADQGSVTTNTINRQSTVKRKSGLIVLIVTPNLDILIMYLLGNTGTQASLLLQNLEDHGMVKDPE